MPDVSFTELARERVVVRRFRPEDVAEFVAYRSDAEVARYQSWDAPYPPDESTRPELLLTWPGPSRARAGCGGYMATRRCCLLCRLTSLR